VRVSEIKNGLCYKATNGQIRVVVKAFNKKVWFIFRNSEADSEDGWQLARGNGTKIDLFAKSVECVVPTPADAATAVRAHNKTSTSPDAIVPTRTNISSGRK